MVTAQALLIYEHMWAVLPNQNLIASFKDFYFVFDAKVIHFYGESKEKMTRPYHFKKFEFPKWIPLQKSNLLKR